jgi:hypothetical protein
MPRLVRTRRALRVVAYKIVWVGATISLLGSTLVELTQPHHSQWTFLFPVVWVGLTIAIVRAVRRTRAEGHA